MKPLLLAMPGAEALAAAFGRHLDCEAGTLTLHRFPDGESCPQILPEPRGRAVLLLAALDHPDDKLLPLYLAASVARELGARRIVLVLPYLPYMRQDAVFQPGQGITARHFARLLSSCCDALVTVDPHLHRILSLDEVYSVASEVVPAAPSIAAWIRDQVADPVIVGPDGESEQWAAQVAALVGCPCTVLRKVRSGDREVAVSRPSAQILAGRTPVLVDDIVSTARTMVAAAAQLQQVAARAPVCIAVHALFAGDAYAVLQAAGVAQVVSCNTVPHASNGIDLMPALAAAARRMLHPQALHTGLPGVATA